MTNSNHNHSHSHSHDDHNHSHDDQNQSHDDHNHSHGKTKCCNFKLTKTQSLIIMLVMTFGFFFAEIVVGNMTKVML